MSKIISFVSGKGGTGKSTACVSLGYALAKQGLRTLIIETDRNLQCLDIMISPKGSAVDIRKTMKNQANIQNSISHSNLHKNLDAIVTSITDSVNLTTSEVFSICKQVEYDYILIDTPANINQNIFDICIKSDIVILVVTPDPISIRDAKIVSDLIYLKGQKEQRLIINKVKSAVYAEDLVEDFDYIIDEVGVQLVGVVPYDISAPSTIDGGKEIPLDSMIYKAFFAISKRLQDSYVPIVFKALMQ